MADVSLKNVGEQRGRGRLCRTAGDADKSGVAPASLALSNPPEDSEITPLTDKRAHALQDLPDHYRSEDTIRR